MFGIFKKKRALTPQEDLRAVMNTIFDRLRDADRKTGIEQLMAINITFGSIIPIIREHFPNVTVEDDGPAMVVMSAGSENPDWKSIESDIAHMLQQVRACPDDPDSRGIVIRSFLSPRYVAQKMSMSDGHSSKGTRSF
jgi:hypothetical protein